MMKPIVAAKIIIVKDYTEFAKNKMETAKIAYAKLEEIRGQESFTDKDIWAAYQLECQSKYLCNSEEPILNLNIHKIHDIFLKIENDKRVLLFDKYTTIKIIDLLYDLRILSFYVRNLFPTINEKKSSNTLYFIIKEALKDAPKNEKDNLSFASNIKRLKDNHFYMPYKLIVENLVKDYSSEFDTKQSIEETFLKILDGSPDYNTYAEIENILFPRLIENILLKKEIEDGNYNPMDSAKMNLLYDILPAIKPNYSFKTEDDIKSSRTDTRSYYQYRVDTFKGFAGLKSYK